MAAIAAPLPNTVKLVALSQEQLTIIESATRIVPSDGTPLSALTQLLKDLHGQVNLLPRYNENADIALQVPGATKKYLEMETVLSEAQDENSALRVDNGMLKQALLTA